MQYPTFLAAGWPIGNGAVESGNKLVVEARLKGEWYALGPAACGSDVGAAQYRL